MRASRPLELARRQRALQVRSAELRVRLGYEAQVLVGPLTWLDRLRRLACSASAFAARHPEAVVAGAALLVLARPQRAWRWARRGWWTWRALRRVGALWALLAGARAAA